MFKTRCVPLARVTGQDTCFLLSLWHSDDKVSFMNVLINNEISEFKKMDKIQKAHIFLLSAFNVIAK